MWRRLSAVDKSLERMNQILARLERVWKLCLGIATAVVAVVLWGARLEWRVSEAHAIIPTVQQHGQQIATLEGRLHGIASQVGKVPGKVAAKLNEEEPKP